ncbi:MAG: VIT domain-containing protein, partial [Lewinella sp.]
MRFLLCIILIYCCCLINAQSTTSSPYFELSGEADFPLESTKAEVNIAGVIADVTVYQTYVNKGTARLEATYVFPGSTNAAVYGMTMIVGNRRIAGVIQRKAEARETYEAAKAEGKRASLLEQHRPNVFQMNVANILPGDTVKVELKYTELLVPESGIYRFVYPTVVGPRFTGESESGTTAYAAQPYVDGPPTYAFDINVVLNAGMPISSIRSPSHGLAQTSRGASSLIMLDPSETYGGNRDYVLEYELQGQQIQTGMLLFEGEKENYFLYLAQPPQAPTDQDYPPREFV